jgi:hypothetical protein
MAAPQSINDQLLEPSSDAMERGRSSTFKIVSILVAVAITGALLTGYLLWRGWHEEKTGSGQPAQTKADVRPALPAKVQVIMDEPVRKGQEAVITGTVHNISNENLSNLSLDAELTHRKDGSKEVVSFQPDPKDLSPNGDGKYALSLTGDYSLIAITRVKAGAKSEEIGFKTATGAKRPPERPAEIKTVIINRPPKKGEEFINTPDNPAKVP